MDKHPIESIMSTTLENIRDMVDVNTIVGEAIVTSDGTTVIPISRVSFGFVAGGGEYALQRGAKVPEPEPKELPFAGGTGAGVSVQPIGFLIAGQDQVRLLPTQAYAPIDRVIELAPQALCEIKNALCGCNAKKASDAEPAAQPTA